MTEIKTEVECIIHHLVIHPIGTALCHFVRELMPITVPCRYNAANFVPIPYKRHLIARPSGRGMGCLLWVQILVNFLLLSVQRNLWYRNILDRVKTALDCIYTWPEHLPMSHHLTVTGHQQEQCWLLSYNMFFKFLFLLIIANKYSLISQNTLQDLRNPRVLQGLITVPIK